MSSMQWGDTVEISTQLKNSPVPMATYALFYHDQTYLTLELTHDDYMRLSKAMHSWFKRSVRLSVGTLEVRSLRSVILQTAKVEETSPVNDGANPALSVEDTAWIRQQGGEQ